MATLKQRTSNQSVFLDKGTTLNERRIDDPKVLVELAIMNAHLAEVSGFIFKPLYGVSGGLLSDVDDRILVTNL